MFMIFYGSIKYCPLTEAHELVRFNENSIAEYTYLHKDPDAKNHGLVPHKQISSVLRAVA